MPKIIGAFTKATTNAMMDDFQNFIKEFEAEWGVKFELRGGKFETDAVRPRVIIRLLNKTGDQTFTVEAEAWKRLSDHYGLRAEWLGKEVTEGTERLRVVGIASRRPKRPVALVNLKTKRMAFASASWLIRRLR